MMTTRQRWTGFRVSRLDGSVDYELNNRGVLVIRPARQRRRLHPYSETEVSVPLRVAKLDLSQAKSSMESSLPSGGCSGSEAFPEPYPGMEDESQYIDGFSFFDGDDVWGVDSGFGIFSIKDL
jgi:hypothetical protein